MPEGPEIRLAADRVERALRGEAVCAITFAFEHLKTFEPRLTGRRVEAVETRGKALLIHFEQSLTVYSHNQLYGRWLITRAGHLPDTRRQLRLAIHNHRKSALLYSASDIAVLTPTQVQTHPFLSRLGPDVLSATPDQIIGQLESDRFRRRRFSSLFLDQHFVAGIGNYLRSEILFVAGLHPRLRPVDCTGAQLGTLAHAAIAVAEQSYRHAGVTTDLEIARRLKAEGERYGRYRHWVFGRAGCSCRRCGSEIVQDVAASRRIYHCTGCQPPTAAAAE